jgi:hypothetical protein
MNNDLFRVGKHCPSIQTACLWLESAWLGT